MDSLPPLPLPLPEAGAPPKTLAEIVDLARRQGYSDIHISVGEEPRFRDRGDMRRSGWAVTDAAQFECWGSEMLSPAQWQGFLQQKESPA